MSSLTERIANYIDKNNPDVILIDSLDYIGYSETAAQKIKMLKKIACAFKVPIICTCKIPHTLKKTSKNAYMRKAGEYADIVVEIWRELYEERDKSRETYFLTHKNNKGQTGSLYFNFDLDKLVFTEQNE
jgi:archaellum biogenesis ATPase FlaH